MSNTTPFFSIIVPVYNVATYINDCLKSIVEQSYDNFEVIIINDGSTDDSPRICDKYASFDKRVKVIHKPNGGLVSARKIASLTAGGRYVINVDGDDYIDNNMLEEIYELLKVASYDVVWYSYNRVNSSGKIMYTNHNKSIVCSGKELYTGILYNSRKPFYSYGYDCSVCTKAVKRELYSKYQGLVPDDIIMGEDLAVTLPVVACSNLICFIDRPFYNYRMNEGSITSKVRDKDIMSLESLLKHLKKHVKFDGQYEKNQLAAYTIYRLFNMLASRCKCANSYKEFKMFFQEIDSFLMSVIYDFKYSFRTIKGVIIPFMVKHKLFWLIWLFYHRK